MLPWHFLDHSPKNLFPSSVGFEALTNTGHRDTFDKLTAFAPRGLTPDIVQVGIEISAGLL